MKLSLIVRGQHPPGDTGSAPARRPRPGAMRRPARLRRHRQGLALQRASVRVRAADPVSVLLRRDRAAAADHLRPGAGAAAQAARSGRATGDARPPVRRQARLRRRHRLPRCRVQGVRRAARPAWRALRGMPHRDPPAVDRGLRHHEGRRISNSTTRPAR